jgi:photosystem II protein
MVLRRFKEDDGTDGNRTVEETKQRLERNLKGGAEELKSNLQNTDVKAGVQDVKSNLQRAAAPGSGFDSQVKTSLAVPAFTRRREVYVGRIAILGIVAAGFWEWLLPSHPNILQQVSYGLNLAGFNAGPGVALSLILGIIGYSGLAALVPFDNPTFSKENQEDVAKRPPGPNQEPPSSLKQALGISGWGFTKKNELFNGRMAMLGFTAGIFNQLLLGGLNGPGPLAQVAAYLRIPPNDAFWSSVPTFFIGFTIFATALSYLRGESGEKTRFGEDDIY